MIEVEKRVLLSKDQLSILKSRLVKEGEFQKSIKRFSMVKVANKDFSSDPDSLIDIKVRTTGAEGKFTLKYGNWHEVSSREEHEIDFQTSQIKDLINILKWQGNNYFVIIYITRSSFNYKDLQLTVDEYSFTDTNLLEIEVGVESESDVTNAETSIDRFLNDFNLKALTSEGTISLINKLNSIKELQVDFNEISVEEWYEKWQDFIFCKK